MSFEALDRCDAAVLPAPTGPSSPHSGRAPYDRHVIQGHVACGRRGEKGVCTKGMVFKSNEDGAHACPPTIHCIDISTTSAALHPALHPHFTAKHCAALHSTSCPCASLPWKKWKQAAQSSEDKFQVPSNPPHLLHQAVPVGLRQTHSGERVQRAGATASTSITITIAISSVSVGGSARARGDGGEVGGSEACGGSDMHGGGAVHLPGRGRGRGRGGGE